MMSNSPPAAMAASSAFHRWFQALRKMFRFQALGLPRASR